MPCLIRGVAVYNSHYERHSGGDLLTSTQWCPSGTQGIFSRLCVWRYLSRSAGLRRIPTDGTVAYLAELLS